MFYKVVDMLSVQDSVSFFGQDDNELLISMLGGMTEPIQTLPSDVWARLMCHIADHMAMLHDDFKYDLYCHIYNLS